MPIPLPALDIRPYSAGVEMPNVAGNFIAGENQAQGAQTARLSTLIQQYSLQKAQRDDARAQTLQQLTGTLGPKIVAGDQDALAQYGAVDPAGAIEMRGKQLTQSETQARTAQAGAQTDEARFTLARQHLDFIGAQAQSILSAPEEFRPMLYARAKAQARALGIDESNAPDEYSDATVQQMASQALSGQQQLDQHWKQITEERAGKAETRAEAAQAETARHNQVEENKPISVAPGSNLINPKTGATVYNGTGVTDTSPVPGVVGHPEVDVTAPGYASKLSGNTGLTQASIDQKAFSYIASGTLPPQGRTGIAGIQNAAISNRMAEMDPGGNLAAHKTDLKAFSSSLTTQQKYLDNTQRALNTANDTLDALQRYMEKNNINASQVPDYNRLVNYLKSKGVDPGAAGGYNAQVATLRAEYSQVLARGGVRSVETDREAAKLIPDGLDPKDLAKVAAQIKVDANNVVNDAQQQIAKIHNQINSIIKPGGGGTQKPPADASPDDLVKFYNGGGNGVR